MINKIPEIKVVKIREIRGKKGKKIYTNLLLCGKNLVP